MTETIKKIQDHILKVHGIHTDVYYQEGGGVIFVPKGFDLDSHNIVALFSELELKVLNFIF